MTPLPQTRRRPAHRYAAFGAAALPLTAGTALTISDHAAGIAWALLVCGAGLLSVALGQPRRDRERPGGARAGSGTERDMGI
ncbi:MAG TPA: hypothetical protein VFJ50_09975 [Gemmatimonadales bacterium]|nr:hypothetical protein [Gemmatimonadales bacterium]